MMFTKTKLIIAKYVIFTYVINKTIINKLFQYLEKEGRTDIGL